MTDFTPTSSAAQIGAGETEVNDAHARLIAASAISPEVARERGYLTINVAAELRRLGFGVRQCIAPGLLIPLWNVRCELGGYQHRPDQPRFKDGKIIKYETPIGFRSMIDVPPRCQPMLGDPSVPLFITEGARKADSAATQGLACIDLPGVWNWRGTNDRGGKTALPDWELIALNSRTTYICFDSDATTKPAVRAALVRLKNFLEFRGAAVKIVMLPEVVQS